MVYQFPRGLSYDDVLLEPAYSEVLPSQVSTRTFLTPQLELAIPIISAAMDTVTEHEMAASLGDNGGAGVIHRNMTPQAQAEQVQMAKSAVRSSSETAAKNRAAGSATSEARIVGAAVAPADYMTRMPLLCEAGVDFVVIDTAHGDSKNVLDTVAAIKREYSVPVVGGNVATAGGTRRLIEAGADAVKVGVGPGSICTTRVVAGVGVPQLSAVMNCAAEADRYGIPVIADGGIRYSGDIVKAIAAGASSVMLGNLLAGIRETPGMVFEQDGQLYKRYRGMGSEGALKAGGADRYQSGKDDIPVPEGVEGLVVVKGGLDDFIYQLVQGLRKGMGYCGCASLAELQKHHNFVQLTGAGLRESHAHTLVGVKNTVNYSHILEYTG